jgi:hypothetical protein
VELASGAILLKILSQEWGGDKKRRNKACQPDFFEIQNHQVFLVGFKDCFKVSRNVFSHFRKSEMEKCSSGTASQSQKKTRGEASFATLDAFIDCRVKGVRSLMTYWCDLLLLFYPSSQHSEEVFGVSTH